MSLRPLILYYAFVIWRTYRLHNLDYQFSKFESGQTVKPEVIDVRHYLTADGKFTTDESARFETSDHDTIIERCVEADRRTKVLWANGVKTATDIACIVECFNAPTGYKTKDYLALLELIDKI